MIALGDTLGITIKHGVRVRRRAPEVGEKARLLYGIHQAEVWKLLLRPPVAPVIFSD